jgi:hypothetical protein
VKTKTKLQRANQQREDEADEALERFEIKLKLFKDEIAVEAGTHKARILEMIKELEDSKMFKGIDPDRKRPRRERIATYIIHRLRDEILNDEISLSKIHRIIPQGYKLTTTSHAKKSAHMRTFDLRTALVGMFEYFSGRKWENMRTWSVEEIINRSQDLRKRQLMAMADGELIVWHEAISKLYPLLKDEAEMMDQERHNRQQKEKLLSP